MAMLAGPRKKQKVINLRAKNNAWSNDSQKFGQRMLEKMGWSSGKGLGAKENGIVEHVIARYKNDEKGLGFEDKNDQWTQHEDDFNSLLANLSNATDKEDKLHSGVSLEKKSKSSRARIHYHKFTRGKDLSRYSEKDLANIFGKKAFKNNDTESLEPVTLQEDIQSAEQKFTVKGSMEDYFQNKMSKSKNKQEMGITPDTLAQCGSNDYSFKGFSGATDSDSTKNTLDNNFQPFSFYNNNKNNVNTDSTNDTNLTKKKKKKSKLKTKEVSVEAALNTAAVDDQTTEESNQDSHRKKSKKSKKRKNREDEISCDKLPTEVKDVVEDESNCVPVKKKKKKNKDK